MGPITPIGRTAMFLSPYIDRAGSLADVFGFVRARTLEFIYAEFFHRVVFCGVGRAQQIFELSTRPSDHVDTCFGKGTFEAMVCRAWKVSDAGIGPVYTQSHHSEQ